MKIILTIAGWLVVIAINALLIWAVGGTAQGLRGLALICCSILLGAEIERLSNGSISTDNEAPTATPPQ